MVESQKKLKLYVRSKEETLESLSYGCKLYQINWIKEKPNSEFLELGLSRIYRKDKTAELVIQKSEIRRLLKCLLKPNKGDILYFDSNGVPGILTYRDKYKLDANLEIIDYSGKEIISDERLV